MASNREFLKVCGLIKRYRDGVLANDGISVCADLGEVIALVGPNGAGKTTFVRQVLGLLRPTAGSIELGGIDVGRRPDAVKALIGYQPQRNMSIGGLTVHEILRYTVRLRSPRSAPSTMQVDTVIEELGLGEVVRRPLRQLSAGWRRLVDVAIAVVGEPKLIVLDEPTNDLDPEHRRRVWKKLDELRTARLTTCLVVTHNLLEAERVVDRVFLFSAGRVRVVGSPGELKRTLGAWVKVDLYVRANGHLPPGVSALLGMSLTESRRREHYQCLVHPSTTPALVMHLVHPEADGWLDDFHISPPSLEDVYIASREGWKHF